MPQSWTHWVEAREVARGHFTLGVEAEEFCDRQNLTQIHQRTLTILRQEVQPVSLFAFADFLSRGQHLHAQEQLSGGESVRTIMQQLRGVTLPGLVWERDVLPARVGDYDSAQLDALVESGELVWVGAGREPRRARVRFFFRAEGALFVEASAEEAFSERAQAVHDFLQSKGASFTADIEMGTGLAHDDTINALVELVLHGVVTNDTADALRMLLQYDSSTPRSITSALEAELAARMRAPRRLTHVRYQAAKRRVRARLNPESEGSQWQGRWSLVQRAAVMGKPLSHDERADRLARVLLARYGVLTRESGQREEGWSDWMLVYPHLQRMEMRGEVRRGYFVKGLSGMQFALPEAVEQLRACAAAPADALVVLNATDPANVFGSELQDDLPSTADVPQVARVPSTHLVLWRGQPIVMAEENGHRIRTRQDADQAVLRRALQAYLARPNASHHIAVREWNGEPVLGSLGEPLLQSLGFDRTPSGMERWM